MKKLITILLVLFSITAFGQYRYTMAVGEYAISSLGSTTYVTNNTRVVNWPTPIDRATAYKYVASGANLDTLTTTRTKPGVLYVGLEPGGTFTGTLTVADDSVKVGPGAVANVRSGKSGAKPIITGFTAVTGWTDEGGGVYSKTLAVESNPEIVTINGVQYAMGRTPNSDRYNPSASDYYHIDSFTGDSIIVDSECNSATTDWDNATIVMKTPAGNMWIKGNIISHTGTSLRFVNSGNGYEADLGIGYGYFIQNDLRTLDQFGEWYYGGGKIYMFFGGATPSAYSVKVSAIQKLINVGGRDFITVSNIKFEGANDKAVATNTSSDAYNLTVSNCDFNFNHTGIYGHRAYEMTVKNNDFKNCTNQAIYQHWYSDGSYIGYNTVDSTGLIIGAGESSWYSGKAMTVTYSRHDYSSKNTIIEHNIVTNSGFSGIHFSGDSIKVRYNFVDTYGLNKADNGGIQFGDAAPFVNMLVDKNIVLNGIQNNETHGLPVGETLDMQYNIYFDYNSSGGHTVSNNVVANSYAGIMIHGSPNFIATNNTIYNTKQGIKIQELNEIGGAARNDSITGNTIVSDTINQSLIWTRSTTNDFDQFGTIDYNYYSSKVTYGSVFTTLVNTWAGTSRSIEDWRAYSTQDANSYMTYNTGKNTIFDYNKGKVAKTVALTGSYMSADSVVHSGSYTLQPWEGIILFKDTITTITIDSVYAAYHMNETSGPVIDVLGLHDGTNVGAVPNVAGKFNKAYDFDTNTDNIYFPVTTNPLPHFDYSVSFWMKLDVLPSVAGTTYKVYYDIATGPSYKVDAYISTSNSLNITTRNASNSSFISSSATGAINTTGVWYLITLNIPKVGQAAEIMINGNVSGTTRAVLTGTDKVTDYRLGFGAYTGAQALDGQITGVTFRSSHTSQPEAEYIYNSGIGRPYPFTE